MSNSKISALTSATTPLAGTETLPIVQSGATKQVSVANLTAGRNIAAAEVTSTFNSTYSGGAGSHGLELHNASNTNLTLAAGYDASYGAYIMGVNFGTAYTKLTLNPYGPDVVLGAGNLIPATAAKGINFTANTPAAGMTSQLLNWYEEGSWTPNQGAGLTVIGAFSSSGKYTRIGRQVTIQGSVAGATSIAIPGTASQICTNLPFSSSPAYSGSMFNAGVAGFGGVASSGTIVYATSTMAATTSITFSITYTV